MSKTATMLRDLSADFTGVAAEFEFDPPIQDGDNEIRFAIVSATVAMFTGPETYLFASDGEGKVMEWSQLPGSRRGTLDIELILREMGYQVND